MKKYFIFTLLALLSLMSTVANADWFFRGTPNSWGKTQMTQVSGTTNQWETTQNFAGQSSPRFKIDRYGNWTQAYPAQDYVVQNKNYKIVFNSTTKAITVTEITSSTPTEKWYFRGTPNNWGATELTKINTTTWETTQDFTGNSSPRFKINKSATDWNEAYPAQDYTVQAKKYKITFKSDTKAITVSEVTGPVTVTSVTVGGYNSVTVNNTINLTATVNYSNGTSSTTEAVTWTTSNSSVATVSSSGVVTGKAAGSATITAAFSGKSGTNSITVTTGQTGPVNGTMIQYFEWYVKNDGTFWNKARNDAGNLKNMGITAVWLPPAYKGDGGINDVGYGVYDLYDLGEFNQKGTVRTKYGTKADYESLIATLHDNGIQVYADVVLNHKGGADATEIVKAQEMNWNSRGDATSGEYDIRAYTVFNFPGRGNTYSSFKWNQWHFDGVDWNANNSKKALYKLSGRNWDWEVDTENGNYDYLMYADIDFSNTDVVNELKNWGVWYAKGNGKWSSNSKVYLDGFRIDAVKHIRFSFFSDWLNHVRTSTGKDMFAVGEYWNGDIGKLHNYITKTNGAMSLFDVPLHYRFAQASTSSGGYDMKYILDNTLMSQNPAKAVTFVDNHDTQPGQALQSPVADWFKPIAYALILLRQEGYPMVFYGDLYGAPGIGAMGTKLSKLVEARKLFAYGAQENYFDHSDVVGWVRKGDSAHPKAMAVVVTDGNSGTKRMNTGKPNSAFYDYTGNKSDTIYTDGSGWGTFPVNGGSVSVWVQK